VKIGITSAAAGGTESLDGLVEAARSAEAQGFPSFWSPNIFGLEAISALAIAARETQRIELGTAVVPTYPRHPFAMAQQALTAAAAAGGRFTLGIGLSHKIVIEDMFGLSYEHPARHMREYLEVLTPLLRGEPAKFEGEEYRVNASLAVAGAGTVPLVVAALGPVMLGLAGRFADGTITWMTGTRTLETHIGPVIRSAAQKAGRPEPRVIAGLPVTLTNDAEAAREKMDQTYAVYGTLPSYRAMLDREGVEGPGGVALLGDESALRGQIRDLEAAGVTDFQAAPTEIEPGSSQRTVEFLASLQA
jgi:F420-dependent oxidoreductase-like protein